MSRRKQRSKQRGRRWLTLELMSFWSALKLSSFEAVSRMVRSIGSSTGRGSSLSYEAAMVEVEGKVESMTEAIHQRSVETW